MRKEKADLTVNLGQVCQRPCFNNKIISHKFLLVFCLPKSSSRSLFLSLTLAPLVALGSVKCEYDCRQDPLQQEGNCPEPSWRQSVDSGWRKRPLPVPELSRGPGRFSGPLRLVRNRTPQATIKVGFVASIPSPTYNKSFCAHDSSPGGRVIPSPFVAGSRCGSTPLTKMFSTSS